MNSIIKCVSALLLMGSITTSCGSAKDANSEEILTGTTWELSAIKGQKVDASKYSRGLPYIAFTKDNKVSGNSGCNGYGGTYNLNDEGGINISQLIATKMFCEGVNENEFFTAIEEVDMTKIDQDKLVLMKGVDEVMTFIPTKK